MIKKNNFTSIFLVLVIGLVIWLSPSAGEREAGRRAASEDGSKEKWEKTPALAANFIPPTFTAWDDEELYPKRNWQTPFLELEAKAVLAMDAQGGRIYYNKNIESRLPMASLTKLMTAIVVLQNYDLDAVIKVSKEAVSREGARGDLKVDEPITVRSLVSLMLIDSSNDAAWALYEQRADFVFLMNQKAKELGLKNTRFANPDGIDEEGHYSSALDIAKIFVYLISNYAETAKILGTRNMVVYSADGSISHRLLNSNKLLGAIPEVKAGKTGYTDNALGCLALLTDGFGDGKIITVILGSQNRFGESEKFINWLAAAYIW